MSLSHPPGYLKVVKSHCRAHAQTCHYIVCVTSTIWIFNLKEIWKKTKGLFFRVSSNCPHLQMMPEFPLHSTKVKEKRSCQDFEVCYRFRQFSSELSGFETSWSPLPVLCCSSARIDRAWHTLSGKTLSLNVHACSWEGSRIWSKITSSYKAGQWNNVRSLQMCLDESRS